MQIDLTDEEAGLLRDLLEGLLPDLRREIARTDDHAFRHQLVLRQELSERLIARLSRPAAPRG
jgi:hypothetical protein